jgi:hypothetical protein
LIEKKNSYYELPQFFNGIALYIEKKIIYSTARDGRGH